jgi:hypothetical protein
MLKKSLIALGALALVSTAAVPAIAATDQVFGTSTDYTELDNAKAAVAQRLERRGIDVQNVDEWGGYVRVDVKLANGQQATQYFEPFTLQPVSVNRLD